MLYYFINFSLSGFSGKSRATRQKIKSLNLVSSVTVVNCYSCNPLIRIVSLLANEVFLLFLLVFNKKAVVISRGLVGVLLIPFLSLGLFKTRYIRESHSLPLDEYPLYQNQSLPLYLGCFLIQLLDSLSHSLIVNHPFLLDKFRNDDPSKNILLSYNGFSRSDNTVGNLYDIYTDSIDSISKNSFVLAYSGSVNPWNGAQILVSLQRAFYDLKLNVQIIVVGGFLDKCSFLSAYDDYSSVSSSPLLISPADSRLCDRVISMSDACILTVADNRFSPGNPLKLYDYIKLRKFVFTPDVVGYSDEVAEYGFGKAIDFSDVNTASTVIFEELQQLSSSGLTDNSLCVSKFSWESRMSRWIDFISEINNKK